MQLAQRWAIVGEAVLGEATLADWLRGPSPLPEVRTRQGALDELRPMLDFREDVAVRRMHSERRMALLDPPDLGQDGEQVVACGLGPVRRTRVLKEIGSVKKLRALAEDDLVAMTWLPDHVGHALYAALHGETTLSGPAHASEEGQRRRGRAEEAPVPEARPAYGHRTHRDGDRVGLPGSRFHPERSPRAPRR